jgi:hypothetical protein
MRLAEVAGDRMKPFLRDSFSTILEGVKIPHKITSGYIDECVVHLIKHVTFKGAIVLFMHEIKESKSKIMRERCLVSFLLSGCNIFTPLTLSYDNK